VSPRLPSRRSRQPKDSDAETAKAVTESEPAEEQSPAAEEQPAAEQAQEQPAAEADEQPAAEVQEQPAAETSAEKAPAKSRRTRGGTAKAARAGKVSDAQQEKSREEGEEKPKRRKRSTASTDEDSDEESAAPASAPAAKSRSRGSARRRAAEPAPSRTAADGARGDVLVRARARYVRTSARKARLVCDHLRGRSVHEARAILEFTPRGAAREWSKLLESAVANAEHNHELLEDDLVVREAYADVGPTIKRYRPRALGRATSIYKRTSHLTITLAPRR
jgi:large subunit ribosomal protein L22